MYKIGIKHNGSVIAIKTLLEDEVKKFDLHRGYLLQTSIVEIYQKKFGLDIRFYRLDEYENFKGLFFIHIKNEDIGKLRQRLREDKLNELGI